MDPPRLSMDRISKRFAAGITGCRAEVRALEQVSLVAKAGDMLTILGGRGAGKTTLIHCAAGLLRPDAGEVRWRGRPTPPASGVRLISGHDHRLSARLALRAIAHGAPELLLVDGALDDLDACDVHLAAERLAGVAASGGVVLVATRLAAVARRITPRCLRLDRGLARLETPPVPADRFAARVAEAPLRPGNGSDPPPAARVG